ncbi:hypothetical protein GQ600_25041 [Phytophthora cactorum]|nr:hypothetical protein GQ600_25041 [Phytophthora cactorum]
MLAFWMRFRYVFLLLALYPPTNNAVARRKLKASALPTRLQLLSAFIEELGYDLMTAFDEGVHDNLMWFRGKAVKHSSGAKQSMTVTTQGLHIVARALDPYQVDEGGYSSIPELIEQCQALDPTRPKNLRLTDNALARPWKKLLTDRSLRVTQIAVAKLLSTGKSAATFFDRPLKASDKSDDDLDIEEDDVYTRTDPNEDLLFRYADDDKSQGDEDHEGQGDETAKMKPTNPPTKRLHPVTRSPTLSTSASPTRTLRQPQLVPAPTLPSDDYQCCRGASPSSSYFRKADVVLNSWLDANESIPEWPSLRNLVEEFGLDEETEERNDPTDEAYHDEAERDVTQKTQTTYSHAPTGSSPSSSDANDGVQVSTRKQAGASKKLVYTRVGVPHLQARAGEEDRSKKMEIFRLARRWVPLETEYRTMLDVCPWVDLWNKWIKFFYFHRLSKLTSKEIVVLDEYLEYVRDHVQAHWEPRHWLTMKVKPGRRSEHLRRGSSPACRAREPSGRIFT